MISRRKFLRLGLAGGALASVASVTGFVFAGYTLDEEKRARLRHLSAKEYLVLRAVARRILDGVDELLAIDDADPALYVDGFLPQLDSDNQRELRGLLHLVEHGTALFGSSRAGRLRRFTSLSADEQDAVLAEWQSSNLTVRRQGFQGLRSLCFMGYYRHDRAWPALGYSGPTIPHRGPT